MSSLAEQLRVSFEAIGCRIDDPLVMTKCELRKQDFFFLFLSFFFFFSRASVVVVCECCLSSS